VKVINGVTYYNDSFASAPPATAAAIAAVTEPKVLIVGGFDRGLDLADLARSFADNQATIRTVLLIGQARQRLAESLDHTSFSKYEVCDLTDMSAIVKHAQSIAQKGDAVVLSPGFASFDMFKDFEERGEKFKEAVEAL
jgi:UDP-N-acetylmuramoylalanine--D-glutamate ligase